ncbi:hypothetical protein [Shewanella fidelis]|uniref:Uncharacterized protein n=1 Tax=Shewanella fidelis TaxID=173509 RepID=A0AAW8NKC8_9GAMM|nr:hypothetical protein [Shewanella fidelis]MDR8523152.1 hypothetical protein [Shewanella fidelis]MDW4811522.1 hypothetical protein [Shewanella fidelis]MDW4815643.1 hypothetical protein [Shewanella fidelis]MDW4819733.1 hypothetical protein [Shewanella fidelis]MDW4824293.1 hypothetical protein [Shewanella fidelis]
MKTNLLSTSKDYFIGSGVMLLGLAYNLIEKDLFGVAAFSLFFIAFFGLALIKRKNSEYK